MIFSRKIEGNDVKIGLQALSDHPSVKRITPQQIVQRTIYEFPGESNKTETASNSNINVVSTHVFTAVDFCALIVLFVYFNDSVWFLYY